MRPFILIFILFTSLFETSIVLAKEEGIGIYIEMLPWEEVNEQLPKYSKFTVMDVETGKKFRVQRRAGNRHADVQPLTANDTKIMKEIYDGKWSWKRRAIIVIYKDRWIAASMNGMPHGAGALKNNFPGHFCIHFYNSTTHRANSVDFAHQLMILKSAGKLKEYLSSREPAELMEAFITGLKQEDRPILSTISLQQMNWDSYFDSFQTIKLKDISKGNEQGSLSVELLIEIEWINNQSKKERFTGETYFYRFSPFDSWKMDSKRFLKEIGIPNKSKQNESAS